MGFLSGILCIRTLIDVVNRVYTISREYFIGKYHTHSVSQELFHDVVVVGKSKDRRENHHDEINTCISIALTIISIGATNQACVAKNRVVDWSEFYCFVL